MFASRSGAFIKNVCVGFRSAARLGAAMPCHQLGLKHDHDEQEGAADNGLPIGGKRDPAKTVFEVQDVEYHGEQQGACQGGTDRA